MHFIVDGRIFIDYDDSMRGNYTLQSECTITTGNQSSSLLNLLWDPSPSSIWVNIQIMLSNSGVVFTEKLCKITECVVELPAQSEIQMNIQVVQDPYEHITDYIKFAINGISLKYIDSSIQENPNQPTPSKLIDILLFKYFLINRIQAYPYTPNTNVYDISNLRF